MPCRPLAILLFCCGALCAQSDEAQLLTRGVSKTSEWRAYFGIAEGLGDIHFGDVDGGSDERYDIDAKLGLTAGGEWLWSRVGYSRLGFVHGPGINLSQHAGQDHSGNDVTMNQFSATYRAGLLMRWDNDNELAGLRDLRFELTPLLGIGVAQVEVQGSDDSDPGFLLRYGLIFETVADWRPGFSTSLAVGYMGGRAWLDWDNTSGSTADLQGYTVRIGAGMRF